MTRAPEPRGPAPLSERVRLVPLQRQHLPAVARWFEGDNEGRRRLGLYGDPERWWQFVAGDERRWGWIAIQDEEPVALLDIEEDDDGETGHVAVLVAPQHRNGGLCRRVLVLAARLPDLIHLRILRAAVEPDNAASLRCLAAAGFKPMGTDEDGLIVLTRTLRD